MKYHVQFTTQFKKDLKLAKKQNKNLDKLFEVIEILASGGTLDAKYRDHDLTGNYKGTRECHVEPDWLRLCRGPMLCRPSVMFRNLIGHTYHQDCMQLHPGDFF